MIARGDVQRQMTIVLIVAVEEPPFLPATQPCVGFVKVQHDPRGWLFVGFEKNLHQQSVDGFGGVTDLVRVLGWKIA
jgi:hypothetical protein